MTNEELQDLLDRADDAMNAGNFTTMESLAREAHSVLDTAGEPRGERYIIANARILVHLGTASRIQGDYTQALSYFTDSLALAVEANDDLRIAHAKNGLGNTYHRMSDFFSALDCFRNAASHFESAGNQQGVAMTLGNVGNMYMNLSEYSLALEYLSKALAMDEELGRDAGIAINLGNIGIVYWNLQQHDLSLDYLKKALARLEALGNREGVAANLGNIGVVYSDCGEYQLSLEYLQKTVALFDELGRKDGVSIYIGDIGAVYRQIGDCTTALEYQFRALRLHQELGNKEGIAITNGNIGSIYAAPEFAGYDPATAEEFLMKAIAIDIEIGAKKQLYTHHLALAELYKNTNQWDRFAIHFEKYHYAEKEVLSEDTRKQSILFEQRRKAAEREKEVAIEKAAADAKHQATEQLLHNVLPPSIAQRMLSGENLIAEKLTNVSVLFADIVEFTKLSGRITPEELVEGLDRIFSEFDRLAEKYGLEKIKTIGDAYMVVSGAPIPRADHAEAIVNFAIEMLESIKQFQAIATGESIQVRIGIHNGDVVAGVIGKKKFAYDLWGDAVNTASRMESHGEPGKIHVSDEFLKKLLTVNGEWLMEEDDDCSSFTINHLPFTINHLPLTINHLPLTIISRGEMEIKGKGKMKTYFLTKENS